MNEKYLEEYKELENKYFSIISFLPTNFPKAVNLEREKKKFFQMLEKKKRYNPQILYSAKVYPKKVLQELLNFKVDTINDVYGLKTLLRNRVQNKINEVLTHKYWGTEKSSKYAVLSRGKPPLKLVKKAKDICKNFKREKVKFKTLTPHIAGERLKVVFYKLLGEYPKVSYKVLVNKMNINPQEKTLTINPNVRFTSLDVKRLQVHEIGTHYLRYLNGSKTGIKLLEKGTANYIETEEGLAAYMEEFKGVSSKAQMFIYAGRVIATHYALTKDFYSIFKILKSYNFKDSDAFSITLRAKRNLSDTSKPGGFTKDYVYLSGYYKIKKYLREGGDLKDLFIGKVKVEDLVILQPIIQEFKSSLITILEDEKDTTKYSEQNTGIPQYTLLDFI